MNLDEFGPAILCNDCKRPECMGPCPDCGAKTNHGEDHIPTCRVDEWVGALSAADDYADEDRG